MTMPACAPIKRTKTVQASVARSGHRAPAQTTEDKAHTDRMDAIFDELFEEFRPAWEKLASM